MADNECGNDCTTRCGSNCCCNSNCRISSAFEEDDERRGRNFTNSTGENITSSSLESNIQMYQRPFSETPDIFKAHIPTSATSNSCYLNYRDSIHEKSLSQHPHHLNFGGRGSDSDCIGPFGNLNLTSTTVTGTGNCNSVGNTGRSGAIVSSLESPLAMSTVDAASLSTASPSGSSSTNVASSSTLFNCGGGGGLSGRRGDHQEHHPHQPACLSEYASLLTPLSILTDVTSDRRNESNLNNSSILPNLYQQNGPRNTSSEMMVPRVITSSNSSSTALGATEMDIGCVSSFDHKLYHHAFTSTEEEDVTWNQFQGSLNSSLGPPRKYHHLQQQQQHQDQQYQLEHLHDENSFFHPPKSPLPSPGSLLPTSTTSPGECVTGQGSLLSSEKVPSVNSKITSASKTFRSVRRWICPPSRQVFSVTNATHHHHPHPSLHHVNPNGNSSVNSLAYGDDLSYQIANSNSSNAPGGGGSFCSPFKIPQIILKESPHKRSKKCLLIICLIIISSTVLITTGGLIINQFINKFTHSSSSLHESSSYYAHQRKFWWKDAILYEIFPPSFKDTNSDGFGDLKGIISKISYIKDLGVTGIRLNSIFTALDYPHQFDHVIDFNDVDPKIGTIDDFKLLVRTFHREGLTVVLDINPSVTSDQHPWATSWLANKSSEYSSFYVINSLNDKPLDVTSTTAIDREGKDLEEIHLSFGGHLYLNWSHPGVRIKMLEVFNFWLNLGVDGFYLKNLHQIQVTSVYMMSEILDDLLEILNLDQVNSSDDDAITRDEEESEDEFSKKFYSKRQVINSRRDPPPLTSSSSSSSSIRLMNQRPQKLKLENSSPSNSLHSLHLNHQINNPKSVMSDEKVKSGPVKPRKLGKRILIASRPSIESLTHRKRLEMESKVFKSSLASNGGNLTGNNNTLGETSERNQQQNVYSHFYPSFSTGQSDTRMGVNSLQSVDFFSYFHLIDTFLDIRMNETENIRDQVNEIFLSDLTKSHPWVLWNIGSSSYSRLASRIGSEFVAAASFLLVSLPGSISLLYGDEIGLTNSYHSISNKEFRGGQLVPMSWSTGANGNLTQSNLTAPSWIPISSNGVNVERSSESIRRFQHLTSFRRFNFNSNSVDKYGNYLFHYINDGEIVLERYFSKRDTRSSSLLQQQLQLHLTNKNSPLISSSSSSLPSPSSSPSLPDGISSSVLPVFSPSDTRAKRWTQSNETTTHQNTRQIQPQFISSSTSHDEMNDLGNRMLQSNITSGPPDDQETQGVKCNSSSVTKSSKSTLTSRIIRSPLPSANDDSGDVYIRTRFVLFANLAKAERIRDFRDKFHSGSIRVTSNAKRMRDFLYLRSLKLDPGEAIIAQVE